RARFRAEAPPAETAGAAAASTARAGTGTSASSRRLDGANRGRKAARPLDAAATTVTSAYATGTGSPWAASTDAQTAASMPPHANAIHAARGVQSATAAPAR